MTDITTQDSILDSMVNSMVKNLQSPGPAKKYLFMIDALRTDGQKQVVDSLFLTSFLRHAIIDFNKLTLVFILDDNGEIWKFFDINKKFIFGLNAISKTASVIARLEFSSEKIDKKLDEFDHEKIEPVTFTLIVEGKITKTS